MRSFTRTCSVIVTDRDGIAQAQTTAGAAAMILNGAGVAAGIATLTPARRVRVFSGGDVSTVVFTITGTDRAGSVITDTVTGVNNSTVATGKLFATVTGVSTSAAAGTNVEVGWNDESISAWIFLGSSRRNYTWTLEVFRAGHTGTVDYDIEATTQNMLRDQVSGDNPDSLITLKANQTTEYVSNNDSPYAAVRLKLNTNSAVTTTIRINPSISL